MGGTAVQELQLTGTVGFHSFAGVPADLRAACLRPTAALSCSPGLVGGGRVPDR